jgi:hypothetical protein
MFYIQKDIASHVYVFTSDVYKRLAAIAGNKGAVGESPKAVALILSTQENGWKIRNT